jgi:outer membrane biosynthesis protein TonB
MLPLGLTVFAQNSAQPAQQTSPTPSDSQQSTPAQASQQPATPTQPAAPATAPSPAPSPAAPVSEPAAAAQQSFESGSTQDRQAGSITEEDLNQMLVGKTFYLRGGYLDDSLSFSEHGWLVSRSPVGSHTLNLVEIKKVHLSKHKVELEGVRYGLHFSNQLAYEDPGIAYDKMRITPKKKVLRITIDRESVVRRKKLVTARWGEIVAVEVTPGQAPEAQPASATPGQPAQSAEEEADIEQAKAEMAAAKPEDRPADPGSVTATTSHAHATMVLKQALDAIFAPRLDNRMLNAMPDFWRLYYKAVAARTDYRPSDPAVMRQSNVDKKARLLTNFEPDSNQFAQDNGVVGIALYHAVIGPDGVPGEIAVARPIGFGLDENAVKAIRAARFEPAEKDGKPVPVLLDLVVQFRIYSKRTNVTAPPEDASKPPEPVLPGPYSAQLPPSQTQPTQQ